MDGGLVDLAAEFGKVERAFVGRLVDGDRSSLLESVIVDGSFGVYLGWVSVASLPNMAVALIGAGVDPPAPWAEVVAIIVLGAAAGLGAISAARLGARWSVAAAMMGSEQLDRSASEALNERLGGGHPVLVSDELDMYDMVSVMRTASISDGNWV